MRTNNWTRNELLLAFNLYCRTPFGRIHRSNSDIIALAEQIDRTPSAVAMKLVNFASLDPVQQARKVHGLRNASHADQALWEEFKANSEQIAFESEQVRQSSVHETVDVNDVNLSMPTGPTESIRLTRVRLVQNFFREAVLSSYAFKCAICALDFPILLTASHIVPWSHNVERRADPRNGLSLCAIHDRAFDRGIFSLDSSYRVVLADRAKQHQSDSELYVAAISGIEGRMLTLPARFTPDPEALAYHREKILLH